MGLTEHVQTCLRIRPALTGSISRRSSSAGTLAAGSRRSDPLARNSKHQTPTELHFGQTKMRTCIVVALVCFGKHWVDGALPSTSFRSSLRAVWSNFLIYLSAVSFAEDVPPCFRQKYQDTLPPKTCRCLFSQLLFCGGSGDDIH